MIQVADNFNYRGKKPNFDRDSFDTLQDMKNYSENSLDDGHISYCKETDKHYKFNSNNQSDPTTGKWVEQHEAVPADEEDITEQIGDKNVLTQAMINKANTIYVIQYDYNLKEASINIPENCVLQFDGGSLSNGTITGNGTSIDSIPIYIFKDIIFEGTFKGEFHVEYMGASIKNEDNSGYFNKAFSSIIAQSEDVYIKNTRDYLVFIQNNSICKVHYSIGNNSNYRTYTINPGISIIMETEIENITMFPAGNNRPDMPVVGYQYFDTTINKPIFYDGSKWIDATGATV